MNTYLFPFFSFSFFFLFLQFKHKKDTSTTCPILLDEPKLEVCPSLLHVFPLPCVIMCLVSSSSSFFFFFFVYICITTYPALFSSAPLSFIYLFFWYFQADPEPFSVYHPTTEEIFTALGTPMEGFFDGAEVVTKAMAFPFAAAQGIHTKTPIPSTEPSPIEEGA